MVSTCSAWRQRTPALAMLLFAGMALTSMARAIDAPTHPGPAAISHAASVAPLEGESVASSAGLTPDRLVQEVLQRNPGIDAMQAASDAAGARIESAGALDDPMVSYAMAPNTAGGPRQGLNQNVQVSQKFPWPGTLDLRSRMATAEAQSADQQVADLRLRLAARARADYAQWYYVHRALAINVANTTLVEHLRTVAEASYASGQSPQQDVLQAEVELVRLRNQALELARLQRTLRAKINALQNLDPGTEVPAPSGLPPEVPLPTYAALQDAALAHYPMLQSLDSRIQASKDRVDLAHQGYKPNITVLAGYNSIMDMPAKRLTVGVAINIPFGGNHRGEVSEANARLHESEAKLADVRNQLLTPPSSSMSTSCCR
jgi:cobalt-zinc-cadmium efflux system outer membrane protein